MQTLNLIYIFSATYISIIILDYIFLSILMKQFIITQLSSLIKTKSGNIQTNIIYALIAWASISIGILTFVIIPSKNLSQTFLFGALLGFIIYSTYDFTNLAIIKNYPLKFALIDITWGTLLCSITSGIGYYIKTLL